MATDAHALPSSIKGSTHIVIQELVIAPRARVIIVRGRLGTIQQLPPTGDPNGAAVDTFVADPDLVERVVELAGDRYDDVFTRGLARGLPQGDFGRQDLLAAADAKGW